MLRKKGIAGILPTRTSEILFGTRHRSVQGQPEEMSPKCIWPHPRLPKTALFKENNKALLHFKLISQGSQLFGRIREELITSTFPGKNILLFALGFQFKN